MRELLVLGALKASQMGWLLLWVPVSLLAQSGITSPTYVPDTLRWNFDKVRMRDGLPHEYVMCQHRDRRGQLWFGTKGGLSCYDGVHLTTYSASTYPSALPADEVVALAESPGRWLWIATLGGLARYDYRTGKLQPVTTPGLPLAQSRGINTLFIDHDQGLWAADDEHLVRYSTDAVGQLVARQSFGGMDRKPTNQLIQAADGTIWVATEWNFIYSFRRRRGCWQAHRIKLPKHSAGADEGLARCLYSDRQGDLWIGTYSDGLIRYTPRTNRYRHILFYQSPSLTKRINHNKIRDIAETIDPNGDRLLYCGTVTDGLVIYNLDRQTYTTRKADPADADGLSADNIRKLLIDPAANLWLATERGVNVYKPAAHKIQFIPVPSQSRPPPYIDLVRETQDSAGRWVRYLTSLEVGTWQHDLGRGTFSRISGRRHEELIMTPTVDDRGEWWVGTTTSFGRFDPHTGRYRSVIQLGINSQLSAQTPVYLEDGYFLVWQKGMARLLETRQHSETGIRSAWAKLENAHPINQGLKDCYDPSSGIWHVQERSNLLTHIPDWRNPSVFSSQPIQIGNQAVGVPFGMKKDTLRRCLWICASNGLFQWSMQGQPIRYYGTANGLAESSVLDVLVDGPDHLWLVGNKGLSKLNLATGKVEVYGAQEGFQAYGQYQYLSPGRNGYFFVSGPKGYQLVDSKRLQKSRRPVPVFLTQVQLENKLIPPEVVAQSLASPSVVGASQNDLQIDYIALDGTYSGRNQYRYQLTGYDTDWHLTTNQNSAIYTNLSPGAYRFRVQATNSDGVWSSREAAFAFVIEPPLWQRWWFIGLLVGGISGLLYGLYRYRLNQLLVREQLRQRIAHDLHDEIGSTLSSISLLSGLISNQLVATNANSVRKMVQKIHADARQTLESMDEIIWVVNPGNDSLQRVVLRVQEYAQPLMEAQNITFSLTIDPRLHDQPLPMDVRQSLYFVTKEALNNLLKYAGATDARVHIGLYERQLLVTIDDNGCGFDPLLADNRTGRRSMRQRAEAIGGQLQIDSTPGRGTRISLTAPLH